MKRTKTGRLCAVFGFIALSIVVSACAGGAKTAESPAVNLPADSVGMTLDQALKEAADLIDERIAPGTKIAPLNFNSLHDKFSGYVLDEVTANLVDSRRLTVVDRKEVDLIRGEFDFQFSGEVGDDSMQQLGRMLGAQSIISGSLTDMGGFYRIVIRVLNVQNASVEVQYRSNIVNDTIMAALLTGGRAVVAAAPQQPAAAQTAQAAPATPVAQVPAQAPVPAPVPAAPVPAPAPVSAAPPAPTTYNVGDTGPAGGIVFYDKGNNSGGWRYLEAAPRDLGHAQWQSSTTDVTGTRDGIGDGKENTQVAVRHMVRPAMMCDQYSYGGFQDWFLPSKDELNLMYVNLKMIRNIGDFSGGEYWSSTQSSTSSFARTQRFSDGRQDESLKNRTHSVRAIRQF